MYTSGYSILIKSDMQEMLCFTMCDDFVQLVYSLLKNLLKYTIVEECLNSQHYILGEKNHL